MTNFLYSTLTRLWETIARLRAWTYRSGLRRQRHLRAPVISVGNLSFGGTGKTPFTIWLAGKLGERGYRIAILTRGYRRASKGVRIIPPGSSWPPTGSGNLSPAHDGDEVQLYLRHLQGSRLPQAAVGIATLRYDAGKRIEEQSPVDVHLLDDGFQHLPLARALDIVLIDASNPWGARDGLPGALREPPSALRRAGILLLTRCEQMDRSTLDALEAELRGILAEHSGAAIFHADTRLAGFRARLEESPVPVESLARKRVAAFCGVGNPDSFFALLRAAGIAPVATRVFPDHHRYNDQDVDQLNELIRANRAEALITTEKDVVNLPNAAQFAGNFIAPAYWAEITLAIREENELMRMITERIGPPAGAAAVPQDNE